MSEKTPQIDIAGEGPLGLRQHSQRIELANEVHARPYESLHPPLQATHLALLSPFSQVEREIAHIRQLCRRFNVAAPEPEQRHFSVEMPTFRFRWERHSEFSSYTFYVEAPFKRPFEETAISRVPAEWLRQLPGELLMGSHVAIEPDSEMRTIEELATFFARNTVAGSEVTGGVAKVWSDFQVHGDGFSRFLIQDSGLRSRQAGRLLQRLCEIEQYRLLALLAFPQAQYLGGQTAELDSRLTELTTRLTRLGEVEQERRLLGELSDLAAEVEQLTSSSSYRFSAARAYYDIVKQRIEDIREQRIEGVQTLREFMERRLAPAMNTCQSTEERLTLLANRVSRASNLLRTRVDISMEEQSRDLLASMDRRARLQLRMQETVEGLSVVVLSYYLMGLVSYGLKGLKAAGVAVNTELGTGVAIPLVVGLVYLGVRRLKRRIIRGESGRHDTDE